MSLAQQIEKQFARINQKIDYAVTEAAKEYARITFSYLLPRASTVGGAYGSPVLTGKFYNSHRVSLNGIDTSVAPDNPSGSASPYGPLPIQFFDDAVAAFRLGDTINISNSVDYAAELERGYSQQTSNGVYRVSAEAAKMEFINSGAQRIATKVNFEYPSNAALIQIGRT